MENLGPFVQLEMRVARIELRRPRKTPCGNFSCFVEGVLPADEPHQKNKARLDHFGPSNSLGLDDINISIHESQKPVNTV
jgi:hypothetical protein